MRSQAPPPFAPQYQGAPPQQAGQYVPTPAPPQKSGFAQGLGVGTGCLLAGVIGIVLLLGGCGVLIAIGSMAGNDSARLDVSSASSSDAVYTATEVNLQAQGVYTLFVLGGNAAPTGVLRKDR